MDSAAGNSNGQRPQSDPALQLTPLSQTLLEQLTDFIGSTQLKNALSKQEKTNDLIHEHMRNVLKEEMNTLRMENEDGKKRNGELHKQLGEQHKQLGEVRKQLGERDAQLQTTTAQLETNTAQLEILKTRLVELQRANTDLLNKNQELDKLKWNFMQFACHNNLVQPTVTVGESNNPGTSAVVGSPVVQDAPAPVQRMDTMVPVVVSSVPIVTATPPKSEHPIVSAHSRTDTTPPALSALAALLPENLDFLFEPDVETEPTPPSVAEPTSSDSAMASPELHTGPPPESPELARPKKKVTFSTDPPEIRTIQPVPLAAGKRKRPNLVETVDVCQVCLVEYDCQDGHTCLYKCAFAGCGKTFPSVAVKRRHEKSHTGKEDGSEQRGSRTPTRFPH